MCQGLKVFQALMNLVKYEGLIMRPLVIHPLKDGGNED